MPIEYGPLAENKNFIEIKCYQAFEPHGRASETWEKVWELKLPTIPYHWKSLNGWQKTETSNCMQFKGKTLSEVVQKSIEFLKEIK